MSTKRVRTGVQLGRSTTHQVVLGTVAWVRRILILLALTSVVAMGCGDDGGSDDDGGGTAGSGSDRARVVELLVAEGETPESASCFAEELSDFSVDEFEDFLAATSSGDADEALFEAAAAAAEICAEPPADDGGGG